MYFLATLLRTGDKGMMDVSGFLLWWLSFFAYS